MEEKAFEEAKRVFQKVADEMGLELISVKRKNSSEGEVLEVFIDKNYSIDLKTIEEYTDKVSPLLDEVSSLTDPYLLDISSGGDERVIPYPDIAKLLGHYFEVKLMKSGETLLMKAEKVDEENRVHFVYFLKGRKKTMVLSEEDIAEIHMGYKA